MNKAATWTKFVDKPSTATYWYQKDTTLLTVIV